MQPVSVLYFYIVWHYTRALADMMRVSSNFLWFVGNYFSITLLLSTLFSPWRRLIERGGKGMGQSFLSALILNTISRGVGAVVRVCTILLGGVALLVSMLLILSIFVVWLVLPPLSLILIIAGVRNVLGAFM